jgi:N utilization substance protein B
MASNRHLARIIALQTLYEQDFRRDSNDVTFDLAEVLERNIGRYESTVDDTDFIKRLVEGVNKNVKDINDLLRPIAPEWPIEEIARMDRAILQLAVFELVYEQETPPKVIINEAVELAKSFGSENSSKFVNGVLGTVLKQRDAAELGQAASKEAKD